METTTLPSGEMLTEKQYPISVLWIFKPVIIMLLISVVLILFGYWVPYFALAIPYFLIANPLIRKNFHYELTPKYFKVKEDVLSKKERNIPYGVIQNIYVKQDVFNRLCGLATLAIENAGPDTAKQSFWTFSRSGNKDNNLGTSGNKINIPGLSKSSAENLKAAILQKIKENPIDDNQSGL